MAGSVSALPWKWLFSGILGPAASPSRRRCACACRRGSSASAQRLLARKLPCYTPSLLQGSLMQNSQQRLPSLCCCKGAPWKASTAVVVEPPVSLLPDLYSAAACHHHMHPLWKQASRAAD